jgi:hypothetical protein
MSLEDLDRPLSQAVSSPDVIHRRWLLSKRAEDGRPMLVREDRVVGPKGLSARQRRLMAAEATEMPASTPALH